MQKQFISLVLAILFGWLMGCNSNPVQVPDQNSNQGSPSGQKVQLLELPVTAGMSLAKTYSVARWVSAKSGGELEITEQFRDVTVTATLSIPKKALSEDQYISMNLNGSKLRIDFDPDGLRFNVPAKLSYAATGLDLSSVPVGAEIKLYYCNQETGAFEEMHSASITYDRASGTITCLNAGIPHFSIYAFGYIKGWYDPWVSPGTDFRKNAPLDIHATGLDLSSIPLHSKLGLYYFDPETGSYKKMTVGDFTYDLDEGEIICEDGELPHFSEHAFGYIKT